MDPGGSVDVISKQRHVIVMEGFYVPKTTV